MLYAAYGSNLHPGRLRERVPSARLCGSAVLEGWGLRFHKRGQDGSSKCDMIPAAESVYVAVYDLKPAEKSHLDTIEGLGNGYQKMEICVPDYGECFLYVAQDSHIDAGLRPFEWYKELVLVGCEYHSFPTDYVDVVRRVPHVEDPDSLRCERWMSFVKTIQRFALP